jgi:hypothetical protein
MVLEVTDLPFIGQYQLVLATEHELCNGTDVAPITDEEFENICAQRGLQRVGHSSNLSEVEQIGGAWLRVLRA